MLYTVFMGKDLNISRLCDAYGALITKHRLELIRSYYDDDLSLAEIAENLGITRQAALCGIRQAVEQLNDFESKLGIVAKSDLLQKRLDALKSELDADITAAKNTLDKIIDDL